MLVMMMATFASSSFTPEHGRSLLPERGSAPPAPSTVLANNQGSALESAPSHAAAGGDPPDGAVGPRRAALTTGLSQDKAKVLLHRRLPRRASIREVSGTEASAWCVLLCR